MASRNQASHSTVSPSSPQGTASTPSRSQPDIKQHRSDDRLSAADDGTFTRMLNPPTDRITDLTDRHAAVLDAAIESFGTRGYYGTSLQRIATAVGLTKPGVLHYIGSKEGLLHQVLTDIYDRQTEQILERISTLDRPLLADFWRSIVAINAQRPQLVHMFSTLSAEALDPEHPAHAYFEFRERASVENTMRVAWSTPAGIDTRCVLQAGLCMMDGLQLRWLRSPGKDLNVMWRRCEDALMPLPLWNGYR